MNDSTTSVKHPTLLFDGYCNLCTQSVLAVIKRDQLARLRFANLQSEAGQTLIKEMGLHNEKIDSVILIQESGYSLKSDAVLDVLQLLGGFYAWSSGFRYIPRGWRDNIYEWVARNRFKWFGKRETCMVPTADLEKRFLS